MSCLSMRVVNVCDVCMSVRVGNVCDVYVSGNVCPVCLCEWLMCVLFVYVDSVYVS